MLTVGDRFPQFSAHACTSCDDRGLGRVSNAEFAGKWAVYFFYPKDFTFVCPTELIEFANRAGDFAERNCAIVAGSTDNEYSHLAWRQQHPGLAELPYPMLAAQKLSAELGILHPTEGVCLRATFVVDPDGVIQWASANALGVGRNVDEVLRVLEALQSGELTACNWRPGDAFVSTEPAAV